MQGDHRVSRAKSPIPAVRLRILNAAFAAFLEKGYAGTTTREIAARARVSKRDLYALFDDKQAILVACIRPKAQRMTQPLELQPGNDRASLLSALEAYGTSFLLEICQPNVVALYRLAVSEAPSSPEVGRALDTFGKEANKRTLADFVRQAQAARLLGKGDPATVAHQFMSLLWAGTMLGLLLRAEEPPARAAAQRRAREAAEGVLRLYPPPS
jgi:AcrR family transcriptional regulator